MYPVVNPFTLAALRRYCHRKDAVKIQAFIEKVWDSEAISKMKIMTGTIKTSELAEYLTGSTSKQITV